VVSSRVLGLVEQPPEHVKRVRRPVGGAQLPEQRGQRPLVRTLLVAELKQRVAVIEQDGVEPPQAGASSKVWRTCMRFAAWASSGRLTGRLCGASFSTC